MGFLDQTMSLNQAAALIITGGLSGKTVVYTEFMYYSPLFNERMGILLDIRRTVQSCLAHVSEEK